MTEFPFDPKNPFPSCAHRKRLTLAAVVIFGSFALLIAQFYQIQITQGDKWAEQADRQHYFIVKEPFIRGSFYSNTAIKPYHPESPQKLVVDIQMFHLYIDPLSIPAHLRDTLCKNLMMQLDIPPEEQKAFKMQFYRKSRNRRLALWIDKELKDTILERWQLFARKHKIPSNALYFIADYQRSYPFGKLLGQLLHTVQNIKDEKTQQSIPTGGLELQFNSYLKGKLGKRRLMRSPRNAFETGEVMAEPQNGSNIYLTINHYLQAIAEEEIEKGVKNCKAKSGWALMLDPYSGEILALAQYPFFYPADYQNYFNDPKKIEQTRVKAILDSNEPGSVMKPITIALALKANKILAQQGQKALFNPQDKMATSDGHFPGRKNLHDTHFHAYLNMEMAIQKSSNIYVARLIEKVIDKLGASWYKNELHHTFGFGERTGIELPGESSGMVPTPGKKHPNGTLEWSTPTPYSLAMGHNILTTSLQLARAYAIFANGGYLVQPTLVRKIIKDHKEGFQETLMNNSLPERRKKFPRVLDQDIIEKVLTAMKYSTKPGGTCRRAEIWGYTEAGKTGTAQKIIEGKYSEREYCSSFIGITPVNQPSFVLVVTMDEPEYCYIPGIGKLHHGGTCAAPVFREIAKRSLEYLGVDPDDPFGYPLGDPRCDPLKADWVAETKKLQELYEKWNNL